jgi:hypothetical protein
MAQITPRTRQETLYTDFHKDLALIPGRNDLARRVNENSVREAIKNVVLTDRGERLFQPTLGSDIRATLFENVTPATIILLKDSVSDALRAFEPRCNLLDVEVIGDIDSNSLTVNVVFNVINNEGPQTISIGIDRVR